MSRRRVSEKRSILPDPKYRDVTLAKFINIVMRDGKKSVAERIVSEALVQANKKQGNTNDDPLELFRQALENVRPIVEVRSRRVGGATYQIPVELKLERGMALAMRWILDGARKRNEKNMCMRLTGELLDAVSNKGAAIKKREDTHRMAEANKAFSHYRW